MNAFDTMMVYSTGKCELILLTFSIESCPSGTTDSCQSGCKFLVDPNSTVPQSVIGSPGIDLFP